MKNIVCVYSYTIYHNIPNKTCIINIIINIIIIIIIIYYLYNDYNDDDDIINKIYIYFLLFI